MAKADHLPIHMAEHYHDKTGCGIPIRTKELRERCVSSLDDLWMSPRGCKRCKAGWVAYCKRHNG